MQCNYTAKVRRSNRVWFGNDVCVHKYIYTPHASYISLWMQRCNTQTLTYTVISHYWHWLIKLINSYGARVNWTLGFFSFFIFRSRCECRMIILCVFLADCACAQHLIIILLVACVRVWVRARKLTQWPKSRNCVLTSNRRQTHTQRQFNDRKL